MDAFWNSDDTLQERRSTLAGQCDEATLLFTQKTQQNKDAVEGSAQMLIERDQPMRILLQYDNGVLVGAKER